MSTSVNQSLESSAEQQREGTVPQFQEKADTIFRASEELSNSLNSDVQNLEAVLDGLESAVGDADDSNQASTRLAAMRLSIETVKSSTSEIEGLS